MSASKLFSFLDIDLPSHKLKAHASKKEILSQLRDIAGHFMLSLYHFGLLSNDGTATKKSIHQYFDTFIKIKNLDGHLAKIPLDTLLAAYDYLERLSSNDEELFKFSFKQIFEYRNQIIEKLDQQQIQKLHSRPNAKTKLRVDPNSPTYILTSKFRATQNLNEKFVRTRQTCYCCQKNFESKSDYYKHMKNHMTESNLKFDNSVITLKSARFEISCRHCLYSHMLFFTIKDLYNTRDIVIEKIVLFSSNSIDYVEDNLVKLLQDGNGFYVDSQQFALRIRHPIVLIYKSGENGVRRYLEQHDFLRLDEYQIDTYKAKDFGALELTEVLEDYYPSDVAKSLCRNNVDVSKAIPYSSRNVRDYFIAAVPLNSENICDVLRILLEMEDWSISSQYDKLTQKESYIEENKGLFYVRISNPDPSFQGVIKPMDEIKFYSDKRRIKLEHGCVPSYHGKITKIVPDKVYFDVYFEIDEHYAQSLHIDNICLLRGTYTVIFSPQRLSIVFQHRALKFLQRNAHLRARLFPEENIMQTTSCIRLKWFNETIKENSEQRKAVRNIVDNVNKHVPFVIFGPPGTGKTTVIVESILQLWNKSEANKILVVAGSNSACDEIAKRLIKILKEIDPKAMLRIYAVSAAKRAENLDDDVLEASNLCRRSQFYPSVKTVSTYPIVIVTLTVAGKYVHGKIPIGHFTHVFIDECGASTEAESIVGISGILSSTGHLIVSGDPKQLGPIIQNNQAAKLGLERSLLERLMDRKCYQKDPITNEYNKSIQTRLVRNYRSHKDILCLPNKMYYDGDLEVHASPDITDWALGWNGLKNKNFPIIFECVKGNARNERNTTSLYNIEELQCVLYYVKQIMYLGINDRKIVEQDIGIVSPYKKQGTLIRAELDKRGWFQIETGSVEIFQGKEKPVIIASIVRSGMRGSGFLDNPKRLNVLITRAQALLIIIGNPETLAQINGWKQVIEYCYDNKAITGAKYGTSDLKLDGGFTSVTSLFEKLSVTEDAKLNVRSNHDRAHKKKYTVKPKISNSKV